ncbi:MAG: GC-type dockerin domain-anchored protein [Phycisphaerales bacterium]
MLTTICNSTWSVMRLVLVAVLMVLAVPVSAARGQCAAGWLPGQGLPGMDGAVTALAVLPGGDLIVGGSFGTAGGVAASNIARYNPSTNTWSALGSGTSGTVNALAVLPGGDVIVGGSFGSAGRVAASNIARYNPTINTWSALGAGLNGDVRALAVLPGGDVIVGGSFLTAGGSVSAYFARYTFGSPAPTIGTQPVARVACAGGSAEFVVTAVGTGPLTYQWRKGGIAIDTGANPSAATGTLTLVGVGPGDVASYDCVVTSACGSVTSNAAVLTVLVCGCSPADVADTDSEAGPDGVIDNGDFNAFFGAFFLDQADPGRLVADIANTDGEVASVWPGGTAAGEPDGAVDNGDFDAFFVFFFQSCP